MKLLLEDLEREAATTGFPAETLEKALRLLSLLNALRSHPFLRGRIALKGGTALNLFVFDVPRLSVDIDLNYIGTLDREVMLAERPKIDQAVQAVCGRDGLAVKRVPGEHAGGKWRLTYTAASGRSATSSSTSTSCCGRPSGQRPSPTRAALAPTRRRKYPCSTSMSWRLGSWRRCSPARRAGTSSMRGSFSDAMTSMRPSSASGSSSTVEPTARTGARSQWRMLRST